MLLQGLYSCSSNVFSALEDVESYIQERPDSALAVLQAIDRNTLESKKSKAKFSLLYAMALDKNYIDTTDVSVIMPAVEYYSHHGSADEKLKALYYEGRIYYNGNDICNAIIALKESQNIAENIHSKYWQGMNYSAIGCTYGKGYLADKSVEYLRKAHQIWEEYGDSLHIRNSIFQLAIAHHNNREPQIADSLFAIIETNYGPAYDAMVARADNEIKRDTPNAVSAMSMFSTAIENGARFTLENYYEYAASLILAGRSEDGHSLLAQLEAFPDDEQTYYWKGYIAQKEGDFITASNMLQNNYTESISKIDEILTQSLYKTEAEYYKFNAELSKKQKESSFMFFISILLICVLCISLLCYIIYKRKQQYNTWLEQATLIAEESAKMLALTETDGDEKTQLRAAFVSIYHKQYLELGHLLDYAKSDGSINPVAVRKYLSKAETLIDEIKNADKQSKFENRINAEANDIMLKLRLDYPSLKESDFRLLSYLIVGFDATTRAILMNESVNNNRVKKSRLLKYISSHPTANKDLYSLFLK